MVGPTGFEPATSTAPWWHATGLRYGPKQKNHIKSKTIKQAYLSGFNANFFFKKAGKLIQNTLEAHEKALKQ